MPQPLIAPMPADLDLEGGWTIRFTALDPTSGATVTGVRVSTVALIAVNLAGGSSAAADIGEWVLVPGPE